MADGDLITEDWQMEYGGALIGGNTAFSIASVEGLADLPAVVTSDRDRLRRHGRVPGDDFLAGREVVVSVEVAGADTAAFTSALDTLRQVTTPGAAEVPLIFQIPGIGDSGKCLVYARPRKRDLPVATEFFYRLPVATLSFYCTDPRIYDLTTGGGSVSLPSTGGGLTFNATANFSFGATSTGGALTVTNSGTFSTPVEFRIDGPVINPRIQNVTTGQTLALDIDVVAGDYLIINTDTRTVLLNGTASRYSALTSTSEWWDLAPGTSEVTFRASTATAATLTTTYRSAWV